MKHLLLLAVCLLVVVPSSATTVNCSSALPSVTALTGADDCTGTNYKFSDFSVNFWGFNTLTISLLGDEDSPDATTLDFGVAHDPDPITTIGTSGFKLFYTASALSGNFINAVYLDNVNSSGTQIIETVCRTSFAANFGECPVGDVIYTLYAHSGQEAEAFFAPMDTVYIRKQAIFDDAEEREFKNGVGQAPEPVTTALIGAGLVAMGIARRKRRV